MRMISRSTMGSTVIGWGLALLVLATPSFAYEEDTHFLMTFVACRAAGFTHEEALTVAAVDQGMDDSPGTVANKGLGGAEPQVTEEWLWHALDRLGNMGPKGLLRRKEHLWQVALTRGTPKEKLIHLGVFFHYQQDTWAHRHHYEGKPHSRDAFTTYNTPVGHARHGHQPDRPPFDPVAAFLALEDTFTYAREFVIKGLGRKPNPFFKDGIKPFTGAVQDNSWQDPRKGKFFHMLGGQPKALQQAFLVELIQAQIGAYTVSTDANPFFAGRETADEVEFETARRALQSISDKYADHLGYSGFPIPSKADKQKMGFGNLTTAKLATDVDFSGTAGENSSATSKIGLEVNEAVRINGHTDLSSTMMANDGGRVYGIWLSSSAGIWDYVLNVDAQGPKGFGSGNMYLSFEDETKDVYCLRIFDSSRKRHTLSYSSKKPTITKIRWNNNGSIVTSCPE